MNLVFTNSSNSVNVNKTTVQRHLVQSILVVIQLELYLVTVLECAQYFTPCMPHHASSMPYMATVMELKHESNPPH